MASHQDSDGTWPCKPCGLGFPTWNALWDHKREMRRNGAESHISCKHCGMNFKTEVAEVRHIQQAHPEEQSLYCPGCGHGPFTRIAMMIAHIERGKCPRINALDIKERRDEKTEFAQRLQAMTKEPVQGNYSKYFGPIETPGPTWWTETAADVAASAHTRSWDDISQESVASVQTKAPNTEAAPDWTVQSGQSPISHTGWEIALQNEKHADSNKAASADGSDLSPMILRNEGSANSALNMDTPPRNVTPRLAGSEGVTDWCIRRPNSPQNENTETTLPEFQQMVNRSVTDFLAPETNKPRPNSTQMGFATGGGSQINAASEDVKTTMCVLGSDVTDWRVNRDMISKDDTTYAKLPGSQGVTDWCIKRFQSPAGSEDAAILPEKEDGGLEEIKEGPSDHIPASYWPSSEDNAASPHEHLVFDPIAQMHRPDHPSFKASRYLSPCGSFYSCPHPFCNKTCQQENQLINHLRSSAHEEYVFMCPACNRRFGSVEAIASHVESSSTRCRMREGQGVAAFLDQLTGGIVNVSMDRHQDGSPKYETSKGASDEYLKHRKEPRMEAKHQVTGGASWW